MKFPEKGNIIYKAREKVTGIVMNIKPDDLMPLYKEISEIIGIEQTEKLYLHFRGQQVLFTQKYYNTEYLRKYLKENYNGSNIGELSRIFGYSERRLRQILKD